MCTGLVRLTNDVISTKSVKAHKHIKVLFQVMAYVHLLSKDIEPFAKRELDPLKVKWEPMHSFGLNRLEEVVAKVGK